MKRRGYDRAQRVNDLIQKALAKMILQDKTDDRFQFVTVTSVSISRDLSYAKVYVSVLFDDEEKSKDTVLSLNRNAKSLRYNLAREVELRVVPELKFVYDESTAQ